MTVTQLSSNELFCLAEKGFIPEKTIFHQRVYDASFIKSLGNINARAVGYNLKEGQAELSGIHQLLLKRLYESAQHEAIGLINVNLQRLRMANQLIFSGTADRIHSKQIKKIFSTHLDALSFYAALELGITPIKAVFANTLFANGRSLNNLKSLQTIKSGEQLSYSKNLNHSCQFALKNLMQAAEGQSTNSIHSIRCYLYPFRKAFELVFIGTACHDEHLKNGMITSHLGMTELYNLNRLGYQPVKMLMQSIVFSFGALPSFRAWLGGEAKHATELYAHVYQYLTRRMHEAGIEIEADLVVGMKIIPIQLGNGLVQLLAIGTAVKKVQPKPKMKSLMQESYRSYEPVFFDFSQDLTVENVALQPLLRLIIILIIIIGLIWLSWFSA